MIIKNDQNTLGYFQIFQIFHLLS